MFLRLVRPGLISFLMLTFLTGCTIEIRSPIKIRMLTEEEKASPSEKAIRAPSPPTQSTNHIQTERPKETLPPTPEPAIATSRKTDDKPKNEEKLPKVNSPAPTNRYDNSTEKHMAVASTQETQDIKEFPAVVMTRTPNEISIVTDDFLINQDFAYLGRIRVKDYSKEGYDKKGAIDALKVEAFKRHGSLVQGITNIRYEKKPGALLGYVKYAQASADVVAWDTDTTASQLVEQTSASVLSTSGGFDKIDDSDTAPDTTGPQDIKILSFDELTVVQYNTLGMIMVKAGENFGFKRSEAEEALKHEAFAKFGTKAMAIINVEYEKRHGFRSGGKFNSISGEVVNW